MRDVGRVRGLKEQYLPPDWPAFIDYYDEMVTHRSLGACRREPRSRTPHDRRRPTRTRRPRRPSRPGAVRSGNDSLGHRR
ncbi:hypothetical protein [Streptomyces sp. NPDC058295]|uniref:hypothetical protein n=1 Tax=Streptomyces sp. NPDC058295 TaxID=3346431 RepID=UPI0036EC4ABC